MGLLRSDLDIKTDRVGLPQSVILMSGNVSNFNEQLFLMIKYESSAQEVARR